jgi:hypothetical protein
MAQSPERAAFYPARYFRKPVRNAALTIASAAQSSSLSKLILIILIVFAVRLEHVGRRRGKFG